MSLTFRRACLSAVALLLLALPAAAATYTIDGNHSSAVFRVKHFNVSNFYGTFNAISGTIQFDAEKPAASSIEVTIKADSVNTRNERRDGHAKSPDFLNAAEFATIKFKSTNVKPTGDDTFEVTGKLTLHGVTHDITVTAEKTGQGPSPQGGGELIGFEVRFSVDRTEYDMGFMVGPLSKEITFILALEAGKK
jgi:polyisoprenoid-binding protein YceI